MKKLIVFSFFLLLMAFSCNDKVGMENLPDMVEKAEYGYKTKVVFRHHGDGECICPNCACPGCKCPLGICACKKFLPWVALTEEEIQDGQVGAAYLRVRSDSLLLVQLGMQAADEYGYVVIEEDFYIDEETVSKISNYSKIKVKSGNYNLLQDQSYGRFGAILVDISSEN